MSDDILYPHKHTPEPVKDWDGEGMSVMPTPAPVEEPSLVDMFREILEKEKLDNSYFRLSFRHSPQAITIAVQDYMNALETGETRATCYCAWSETLDGKAFRVVQEHPLCRVHSKEGRIIGFLMYWAKGCVL